VVRELQPGLWHWTAPHPEWTGPDKAWEQKDVSSYATDDGERLLLFDPLALPSEIEGLAGERETVIVLTSTWHRRDATDLRDRHGWPIYSPPPDRDPDPVQGRVFRPGDRLEIGVEAFSGREDPLDLMLWVENWKALVAGDTLVDRGHGLEYLPEWAADEFPPEQVLPELRKLLALPVDLVLPTHGNPTDKAALERALA
jgi:glyoxylase-like metal-dependent hydrolase (beta-lactamase superfamily II)